MKIRRVTFAFICAICLLSSIAFGGGWQEPAQPSRRIEVHPEGDGAVFFAGPDGTFAFVSAEMSFDGKVIKGAPFSAQTVSEHIQVMADGNRIVNTNSGAIFRDSEGRTRREQQITALGGFTAENAPPKMISIHDPVAGTSFALNARDKTAIKRGNFKVRVSEDGPSDTVVESKVTATVEPSTEIRIQRMGPRMRAGAGRRFDAEAKTESLGKQVIEGVEAEGTRTTQAIPAGAIGNEQPINIVSERWYSPDLQTVIMTKHSDPRFGESTFRLTNIDRSEPSASLFQVPSDYTVSEGGPGVRVREEMRARRRSPKEQ